jgi:2-keto-3-deoxy-L-rhamnonate aldolase RhmA
MRSRFLLVAAGATLIGGGAEAQQRQRFNPVIELLEAKKPIFGVNMPAAGRGGGGGGRRGGAVDTTRPAPPPAPVKTAADLAKEALAYPGADYLFSGSMERSVDGFLPTLTDFVAAMTDAGWVRKGPFLRLTHPIGLKAPPIRGDTAAVVTNISKMLNAGTTIVHFVHVNTADELRQGIAAMRFKSKGGTRPDDVGLAPKYWGMTEQQYREKADVWPLNPNGELLAMPIIETKEGIANIREIAAVKGVAALIVGAGTLGGVFVTTNPDGTRMRDTVGFNAGVNSILSACKEFKISCGYPALDNDIEAVLNKGFNVIIIQNWGERGFKAVEIGRRVGGR